MCNITSHQLTLVYWAKKQLSPALSKIYPFEKSYKKACRPLMYYYNVPVYLMTANVSCANKPLRLKMKYQYLIALRQRVVLVYKISKL